MDFQNTKLVAFGDSFTFGQGVHPIPTETSDRVQLNWKEACNTVSYAFTVKNSCKFGSYENYCIPGNSNSGILNTMRMYYENNKTNKNVTYLIGLTHPDRDMIMRGIDHSKTYDTLDFSWSNWLEGHTQSLKNKKAQVKTGGWDSPLYHSLSRRSMEEWMMYYWNNFTIILKHSEFYFSLIDFLEKREIDYILVDVINDVLYRIEERMILDKIKNAGWRGFFEKNFNFDEQVRMYVKHAKSNKRYMNWHSLQGFKYFPQTDVTTRAPAFINLNHMLSEYGVCEHNNMHYFKSEIPDDFHWNQKGNKFAGRAVADFMLKYYTG